LLRVYARELETVYIEKSKVKNVRFAEMLRSSIARTEKQVSCGECGKKTRAVKRWVSSPKVLAVSIAWDNAYNKFARSLLRSIDTEICARDIFKLGDRELGKADNYIFRAMICFHYSHYSMFIYAIEEDAWYQIDDSYIKKMRDFYQIVQMMAENQGVPVLLVYENCLKKKRKKTDEQMFDESKRNECFSCELF
jgi:hypothetical protein